MCAHTFTFTAVGEPTEDTWHGAPLFEAFIDGRLVRADTLELLMEELTANPGGRSRPSAITYVWPEWSAA